jgi:WD40 repeat protein
LKCNVKRGYKLDDRCRNDEGWVQSIVMRYDGKAYATVSNGFGLWDTETTKMLWRQKLSVTVESIAFSRDGKTFASGDRNNNLRIWDVEKRAEKFVPQNGHRGSIDTLVFSPDGKKLATGGADDLIIIWDTQTGAELQRLTEHQERLTKLYWTADYFASYSWDKSVRFWDLASGKSTRQFLIDYEQHTPALSSDGATAAHISMAGDALMLNTKTGKTIQIADKSRTPENTHQGIGNERIYEPYLIHMEIISDHEFAAGSYSGNIYRWNLATNTLTPAVTVTADGFWAESMVISHDKRFIAFIANNILHVVEWASGQQLFELKNVGHELAFSHDHRLAFATIKTQKTDPKSNIQLIDILTATTLMQLPGHVWQMGNASVNALAFSPDGKTLASGGAEGTALIWDVSKSSSKARTTAVNAAKLEDAWNDLQLDAPKAFRAAALLIEERESTIGLLHAKLKPKVRNVALEKLMTDLDSDEFDVRVKATENLVKAGLDAIPYVEPELCNVRASPEVVARCKTVMQQLSGIAVAPVVLQESRAVMVLERIGTPHALELLERLAQGNDRSRITREAKASLERLKADRNRP